MKQTVQFIDLTPDEASLLREKLCRDQLEEQDREVLQGLLESYEAIRDAWLDRGTTIQKLLKLLFGPRSERTQDVVKDSESNDAGSDEQGGQSKDDMENDRAGQGEETDKEKERKKKKGHGRNGADQYKGLERILVPHPDLKAGDPCPECSKGNLYPSRGKVLVRLRGEAPIQGKILVLEQLRCNPCGALFTAPAPEEAGEDKYDPTVGAMIANLRYGYGMPMNRIEKLQMSLGIPLPASTQWDILEAHADRIHPIYPALVLAGAQGETLHNDDTPMKVLSLIKQNQEEAETLKRKGMFTTAVVSVLGEHTVALYFTGRRHAGENLAEVLKKRESDRGPPIQMSDALSHNAPKGFDTIRAGCMDHGRRRFVEVVSGFPREVRYVLEALGEVYKNERRTKQEQMSPTDRLRFHQTHSAPVLFEFREWCQEQFEQKTVEPNSGLGKAISYVLDHWLKLTLFLWWPGVPLSNAICEQTIKRAICHRKNSLFYKNEHGAYIGDLFMSAIHTSVLNDENPFHYMTELAKHSSDVFKNPSRWLPWNYRERIAELNEHEPADKDPPPE